MALKLLVQQPLKKHTATIVFLHGLGDSGAGWKSVAEMLSEELPHVKWILPTAQVQPVTLNFGMQMTSWFDITSLDNVLAEEDEKGILASVHTVNQIITDEISESGITADRLVIGGFSQGGVISLVTGLTNERHLAGIVSLSGFLGIRQKVKAMMGPHATKTPIFMGHGTADQVVAYKFGTMTQKFMTDELKIPSASDNDLMGLKFNTYSGLPHSVNEKELAHLSEWLKKVVPDV